MNELDDNPTLQVDLLNKTIHNIMSSFVPNKTIRIKPSKPAWITREIKNMLGKQNRKYKEYKNNEFREVDRIIFDQYRKECNEEILRLADKNTGQKTYWEIVINLLNKCKIPRLY